MFISINQVSFLVLVLPAWVLFVDGRKIPQLENSISTKQDQVNNEDKLDYLFDENINDSPDDLAYLADAVKKAFPASTHSQTPASSRNCDLEKKKISERMKFEENKAKAVIILGRIRIAFSRFFTAIIPTSIVSNFSETKTELTTLTTTTPTTIDTISTNTSVIKRISTNCSTTTATTGTFNKTSTRNPEQQVEQCLLITVPAEDKIEFTCTSVYANSNTGTHMFYDKLGTNLIVDMPIVNVVYTTSDNTLLIKALATNANQDHLCCNWTTVVALKNRPIFVRSRPDGPYLLKV